VALSPNVIRGLVPGMTKMGTRLRDLAIYFSAYGDEPGDDGRGKPRPRQQQMRTATQSDPLNAPALVLHVFPTFAVGGAQVRFTALANHFGPDFRHMVVALDGDLGCKDRLDPGLDVSFPSVEAPKRAMLANAWRFRSLLRRWRPDVLVTGNWGAIEFAIANLPPLTRHLHVVDGFGPEERETQIRRRVLLRRLVLARGKVIVPSRNLERIATEIWKLPPRVVKYVPNGIDLARFSVVRRPDRLGPPVIGTVAALREEKNLSRLIRAFAAVAQDHACRLVIVGDGAERAALTALAADLGVSDRVTFTGHRDDTPALYAGFDMFALTSDTEQMPLSVIEAMASGLPVVSTDVGDVRSMLAAENAPYVGERDDAVISGLLAKLLAMPEDRARIGGANRAKAERDFDQAVMFATWRDLWSGLA
jgi:glycosyltransferase involved in cell wall biosynthesis